MNSSIDNYGLDTEQTPQNQSKNPQFEAIMKKNKQIMSRNIPQISKTSPSHPQAFHK